MDLECLFLHNDEVVYNKLKIIKYLNEGLYDKIFPLLGVFHTFLVKLKILNKKHGSRDKQLKDGMIVIQPGTFPNMILSLH